MKKYIFKSAITITLIGISFGCSEEFLEKSPTDSFISNEDYEYSSNINPELLDATLNGIYSSLITTGTGGTDDHDDFGQKGYDIMSDFLSGDMALSVSTYGWYRDLTTFNATQNYAEIENYKVWRYYYRVIKSCNKQIAALGGEDGFDTSNSSIVHAMGQAKALRAYAYFYLTQFYITEYNADSKVLPIYTEAVLEAHPQSTTKEVYDLIVKDLTEAIDYLEGFQRNNKSKVNQDIAKTLLAYTYGARGESADLDKAAQLTSEVIAAGNHTLMSSSEITGGFDDVNTSGWMWGYDLTLDMDFGLISWWGQMDYYTYSYQWAGDRKVIDQTLFDQIPADDARKGQFHQQPGSSFHLLPINKFYHEGRSAGGQGVVTTDYVFMRIAEVYLLNAEMAAKSGDEATAKSSLKALVSQRMPDASYIDTLSGQSLLNEIYLQTRIELWGEGKSYLALKRNKANIVRGANHLSFVGETIPHNDERIIFEIPQSEVQNNPFID